jgi:CRISPR-associated protein Csm5
MAFPNTDDEAFRRILSRHPEFSRAMRTGMPFPKTRRVVFLENQPATLPGWVWLGVG